MTCFQEMKVQTEEEVGDSDAPKSKRNKIDSAVSSEEPKRHASMIFLSQDNHYFVNQNPWMNKVQLNFPVKCEYKFLPITTLSTFDVICFIF